MTEERISYLFARYMEGEATENERLELSEMALMPAHGELFNQLEANYWERVQAGAETIRKEQLERMMAAIGVVSGVARPGILRRMGWRRIAAVLLIGVGCWVLGDYLVNRGSKEDGPEATVLTHDVKAPEGNRAVIQLADGRLIYLDSAGDGALVQQGGVMVVKSGDGRIEYQTTVNSQQSTETVYNTITNPRGSKVIDMTLSDGSHVWLNAGSSLRYPVVFAGNERKVEITGEAYFEVAHNTAMPFYVSKGDMEVKVLGTHFNVNAYEDEGAVRVTLLEGSVEVKSQKSKVKIVPGQQAIANPDNGQLTTDNRINLEEVMAWKNGRFYFNEADIQTIMRQVARWYNVEVVYEGAMPAGHYNGKPSRNLSAAQMLKVIEYSGVKIRIEGNKIFVKQ